MTHFLLTNLEDVLAIKYNLTTDDNTWRIGDKTHHGEGAYALTAGALTNNTYTLTFVDMIREIINCLDFPILGIEIGSKIFYFKYFFSVCDVCLPLFRYGFSGLWSG